MIVGGKTYRFRLRAKNVHGWSSAFSPELSVLASDIPAKPDPITTEINNQFVRISWTSLLNNNFEAITKYQILVQDSTGVMREVIPQCDGSTSVIVFQRFCEIPMTLLTSAPFSLSASTLIKAQIRAQNKIGWSPYSDLNTVGVVAQTAPLQMATPTRDDLTTIMKLVVDWTAPSSDGAAAITSYNL